MEINYQAIGQRIQAERIKRHLTQEALSNITDLSASHVCHIENGKTKVSLPALIDIANALGVTVDSLLYDNLPLLQDSYDKDFKDLIADCSSKERRIILEIATQAKKSIR